MLGIRPLVRMAVPGLCGAKGRIFQQACSGRRASTWLQDVAEASDRSGKLPLSGRIHILGIGNVGTFIGHSLASRPSPPPVTLMLHYDQMYLSWLHNKERLIVDNDALNDAKTGFDVEVRDAGDWRSVPSWDNEEEKLNVHERMARFPDNPLETGIIECLIISVKAPITVAALKSVCHRLTPNSTILFLQNGMGVIDEINRDIFPDPTQRPHYMLGISSHALAQLGSRYFQVRQSGMGTLILGSLLPQAPETRPSNDQDLDWAPSTKYLLRTLTLTPPLAAVAETPSSIMLYQLEKLAMNCVINPLTALMGCLNGNLLNNSSTTRLIRLLLLEVSSVICSLPELQGIPGIESRFSPERLHWMVTQLAQTTAKNRSSMFHDVRHGRTTEIEYLNGYIARRGEELGIKCVVNYTIQHLVIAKQLNFKLGESAAIPFDLGEEVEDKTHQKY
ncbi:ketopantoate reductase PanE/ApbA C terminal-domain-containing protein [Aspergillus californicus]